MATIRIINRSDWPDWAIEDIGFWIAKRAGITWDYKILLKNSKKLSSWAGRGNTHQQKIILPRRFPGKFSKDIKRWPYAIVENRYKDAGYFIVKTRLELLIFLMAHEAHHACGGNPRHWQTKGNGRTNNKEMEIDCNDEGAIAVQEFRLAWPKFMAKWRAKLKKHSQDAKPEAVIEKKHALIACKILTWEKKAKRANTALKKYRRQLLRYETKLAAINKRR